MEIYRVIWGLGLLNDGEDCKRRKFGLSGKYFVLNKYIWRTCDYLMTSNETWGNLTLVEALVN